MPGYDMSGMVPPEPPPTDLEPDTEAVDQALGETEEDVERTRQMAEMRERLAEAEAEQDKGIEGVAAFIVIIDKAGNAIAFNDVDQNFTVERQATPEDMLRAVSQVRDDLLLQKTAQAAAIQMMIMGQQAAMQAQEQAEIRRTQALIAKGGNLAKGGVPRVRR